MGSDAIGEASHNMRDFYFEQRAHDSKIFRAIGAGKNYVKAPEVKQCNNVAAR